MLKSDASGAVGRSSSCLFVFMTCISKPPGPCWPFSVAPFACRYHPSPSRRAVLYAYEERGFESRHWISSELEELPIKQKRKSSAAVFRKISERLRDNITGKDWIESNSWQICAQSAYYRFIPVIMDPAGEIWRWITAARALWHTHGFNIMWEKLQLGKIGYFDI